MGWDDILGGFSRVVGGAGDAYLLIREQQVQQQIAKQRAAAEVASAQANALTAAANRDMLTKFGWWALIAAGAMVGITLLSQVGRMWRRR